MDYSQLSIFDIAAELYHRFGDVAGQGKTITIIRNIRGWLFGWKPPCPPYTMLSHPYSYKELREMN